MTDPSGHALGHGGDGAFPWRLAAAGVLLGMSMLARWFPPAEWAALGAVAIGLPPVAKKGLVAMGQKVLGIDFLMAVAVLGALAIGAKVVVIVLAVLGLANLWLAVAADTGTSLVVIALGLGMLRYPEPSST